MQIVIENRLTQKEGLGTEQQARMIYIDHTPKLSPTNSVAVWGGGGGGGVKAYR